MFYKGVIVIGTGKIACDCIGILSRHSDKIACIENERNPLSLLNSVCKRNSAEYRFIEQKDKLTSFLQGIEEKTLVVSSNNNYIFPASVLNKNNLKIINFHNALLPRHPGRNAVTWAIFEQEDKTGITWHEVNSGIDTGDIIIQKEIPISLNTTALELTKKCMEAGADAFREIIEPVMSNSYHAVRQESSGAGKLHYSHDVPGEGILDISWPIQKVSAFLRSLDYGRTQVLPIPRLVNLHREYFVTEHKIVAMGNERSEYRAVTDEKAIVVGQGMSIFMKLKPVKEEVA